MHSTTLKEENREKSLYLGSQIIWYALFIIDAFLLIRLFLKLFGANTSVAFTQIVYNVSGFFLTPFRSIFGSAKVLPESGSVFEFDIIVAIIVYWLIAIAIIRLFGMGRKVTVQEAHEDLENNA